MMRRKLRFTALAVSVAMGVAALGGCASQPPANADGTASKSAGSTAENASGEKITVLLPPWSEPSAELINKFEQETGIQVELNITGFDDIRDKIVIAAVSKVAPADVFEIDWTWAKEFMTAGCVEPFELTDVQKQNYPLYTSFTIDDQTVAMPYSNDFRVGFYNTEHMAQAGIENAPTTWDELVDDCVKIKEAGICEYPLGLTLIAAEDSATQLLWLEMSRSGKIFNDDESVDKAAMLDSLTFLNSLLTEKKIIDPAATSYTGDEVNESFLKGNFTFSIAGAGTLGRVNNPEENLPVAGKVNAMLVPGNGKDIATGSFGLPEGIGISSFSEHKEAARKFVDWFVSEEVQRDLFEVQGTMPSGVETFNKLGEEGKVEQTDVLSEQMEGLTSPFPHGLPTWYAEYTTFVGTTINALGQGSVTPEQAADQIAAKVDELRTR